MLPPSQSVKQSPQSVVTLPHDRVKSIPVHDSYKKLPAETVKAVPVSGDQSNIKYSAFVIPDSDSKFKKQESKGNYYNHYSIIMNSYFSFNKVVMRSLTNKVGFIVIIITLTVTCYTLIAIDSKRKSQLSFRS